MDRVTEPPPPTWRDLLPEAVLAGRAVPWLAPEAIDHLGEPDAERVTALSGATVLVPRTAMGHLRLTGADRIPFAQGLLSHDVVALAVDAAVDALLLDHRGQPQAGVSVTRRADDLFLAVDDGDGPMVARVLREHVIFDQVTVDDVARLRTLTILARDDAALAALADAALPGTAATLTAAFAAGTTACHASTRHGRALWRLRALGAGRAVDLHLLAEDLVDVWPRLVAAGGRPVGERSLTAVRVAAASPTVRGEGRFGLPQETGLGARVARRKGCYLGQEIMARVEARGNLRRALRRIAWAGPPPALGLAEGWSVHAADGTRVGSLGSAAPTPDGAGWWGLALVRRDADLAGATLIPDGALRVPAAPVPVLGAEPCAPG